MSAWKEKNTLRFKKFIHDRIKNLKPKNYNNFLRFMYRLRTGKKLNIDNPQKYTEKMQFAKINLATPIKTKLSDKYEAREWVADKIGSEYLIPLLGKWDAFDKIDFEELPKKFILKTNHASGSNIIVENKEELDYELAEFILNYWLDINFAYFGDLQLHYADITPLIIAEKNIKLPDKDLIDYRFICFDGVIYYCWVDFYTQDNIHYSNIYDMDWNLQPWRFEPMQNSPYSIDKPENFDEMVSIVKVLAKDFSHVRVDLYNVGGKIYFGEMTFTSTGGYRRITPDKYNYALGDLWKI